MSASCQRGTGERGFRFLHRDGRTAATASSSETRYVLHEGALTHMHASRAGAISEDPNFEFCATRR